MAAAGAAIQEMARVLVRSWKVPTRAFTDPRAVQDLATPVLARRQAWTDELDGPPRPVGWTPGMANRNGSAGEPTADQTSQLAAVGGTAGELELEAVVGGVELEYCDVVGVGAAGS